jgi:RNA polymerase sigma-70 factor (ECF subfamily)
VTPERPAPEVHALVDQLFRHHAAAILSALSRRLGLENLDLAEEVVQEAMLQALRLWPYHGIPENPRAWLARVAHNKALDLIRRRGVFRRKRLELEGIAVTEADLAHPDESLGDEQLAMIFACNHPALSPEGRVALTLNAACGFSVPEIARAFLALEATIAQRLVRAKRLIREQEVDLTLPPPEQLPGRIDSVLQVIYLLFNEGYSAHSGDALIRHDLCGEAIWLADRLVDRPETAMPKCHALLALMLIQASRLPARQDEAGDLVLLPDQDRSRWDSRLIHLGLRHLDLASDGDELTVYHIQAGIAAVHAMAPDDESTDWPRLLSLYDLLTAVAPSPIVSLNRAVALAMVEGPAAGLFAIEEIEGSRALDGYFLLAATRADLLRKLGRLDEAEAAYRLALDSTCTEPQRRFLLRRLAECRGDTTLTPIPDHRNGISS